jgi:SAM-dependent methyltransferase
MVIGLRIRERDQLPQRGCVRFLPHCRRLAMQKRSVRYFCLHFIAIPYAKRRLYYHETETSVIQTNNAPITVKSKEHNKMKQPIPVHEQTLMSNNRFRLMTFIFKIRDSLFPYSSKLNFFGIREGDTVVDCGCGTGSCLEKASELVGHSGTVYAADIHEFALAAAEKIAKKCLNIRTVRSTASSIPVPDGAADTVFALDMFHMVSDPDSFLKELRRITAPDGKLIIEDGHQPRSKSKQKILNSGSWKIIDETRDWIICTPVFSV